MNTNPELWKTLKYFTPRENWGDPDKMEFSILWALEKLRNYTGRPINVHCGWEERDSGNHPKGIAADIHIFGMHIIDQFIAATRIDDFNGIGV